jgi:RNA polymerase sigma factor (sigma-70 family)
MPQATFADALTDLCRWAATGPDALPDGELLRRYVDARDETAFVALVRRHGRVVWGAALRRTADRQAAEDVFQATFLILARRARRLHTHTSLSGWLYTVSVRLARKAARRRRTVTLDGDVCDSRPDPLSGLSARELLKTIDDEIGRLPESLRLPVVLCCLDGLSRDEAALRLGCTFGSLKARLERGRELLRRRLARRGMSLPAVLGGLVVMQCAVPPDVAAGTITALFGGVPRPAATALAGALHSGRTAGLISLATAAMLGLGLTLMPAGGQPKTEPKAATKEADVKPASETLTVKVLRDGKPAAGAKVWIGWHRRDQERRPEPVITESGPDGFARLTVEAAVAGFHFFARDADGRIGALHTYPYEPASDEPPTIHLVPVGEITGQFQTPDGKPIAGVELSAQYFDRRDDGHEPARPNQISVPEWVKAEYKSKTDAAGRFRIAGVPVGYKTFTTVITKGFGQGYFMAEVGKPIELTLQPAGALRVKLGGPGDVKATKGIDWHIQPATKRAADTVFVPRASGTFDGSAECLIPNLAPGKYRLAADRWTQLPAWVKYEDEIVITSGATTDLAATVESLGRVAGRVVDADTGKGIANAKVFVKIADAGSRDSDTHGWPEADGEGRFVAYGPPSYWAQVFIQTRPPGYAWPHLTNLEAVPQVQFALDAPQKFADIRLRRTTNIQVAVADEAGKPVNSPTARSGRIGGFGLENGNEQLTGKADGTLTFTDLLPGDIIAPRVRKGDAVNVPMPIEVGQAKTPVITVSDKNACRVSGRVTDASDRPLVGAKVVVLGHFRGVGRYADFSSVFGIESLRTDTDGRYRSPALWPKDDYHVTVSHNGYAGFETKQVHGEAGKVHDLGTVRLVSAGRSIRGRVIGADGKPLAGVTVLNRGDGPTPATATTGPDGSFTLDKRFDADALLLANKDGYRMTYAPARLGGDDVTLTLRKITEPSVPWTALDGHEAAIAKFTRSLLETLWADRDLLGGYERSVFRDMARFDPVTAKQWRDDEKKRTGGKNDYSRFLNEVERERTLLATAREDLDEALASIPKTDRWDVIQVIAIGEKLLKVDKAKALRAAEEAAARARSLDPADRLWPLARAGDLAVRAGNEAGGKKLLAEAAKLAPGLLVGQQHSYYLGLVAASIAPHDEPAAHKLIESYSDSGSYNQALHLMVERLAETNPIAAEAILKNFRPGNDSSSSLARVAIGYRLATADPARAEAIIDAAAPHYRILGLARLGTLVAPKDRERGWRLIDRAIDLVDKDPQTLGGWAGGPATAAAMVAVRGREAGHPDVGGLVARALAHRPANRYDGQRHDEEEKTISLATVLAFVDPAAARGLLAGIAPPDEFAKRAPRESRDWLIVAAVADPEHAGAVVDAIWKAAKERRGGGQATSNTGLIELLSILTGPGDRLANVASNGQIPRVPDLPQ